MSHFFSYVSHWNWLILGLIFLIAEVAAPGLFFLWLGIAAAVVGLALLVAPALAWPYQLVLFALAVALGALLRAYLNKRRGGTPGRRHR